MTYQKITTHKQDSIDNLIFQFRKNCNVKDLVDIDGERFQDLENTLFDIYNAQFIDRATGQSLEFIGAEVGKPRPISGAGSTDDNEYRALIRAKIAANRSNSTLPEVYNILGLLGANKILARDVAHAALKLQINGTFLLSLAEIKTVIIGATAPIQLELNSFRNKPFGFLGNPNAFGFGVGELGSSI